MNELDPGFELILARLIEQIEHLRFGKYRGTVATVHDDDGLCRITAKVPEIYGTSESPPAMPAVPFAGPDHGMVFLPEQGDGVWIEFEAGDINRPIYSGFWWANDQRPEPAGDRIRLIATKDGHQIILDEENNEIEIKHPGNGSIKISDGEISLTQGNSSITLSNSEINMNDGMVKVTTAGVSFVNDQIKFGA